MWSVSFEFLSSRRATPERLPPCEGAGEPASHREETIHALSISRCGQSSTVGGACEPEHNLNVVRAIVTSRPSFRCVRRGGYDRQLLVGVCRGASRMFGFPLDDRQNDELSFLKLTSAPEGASGAGAIIPVSGSQVACLAAT